MYKHVFPLYATPTVEKNNMQFMHELWFDYSHVTDHAIKCTQKGVQTFVCWPSSFLIIFGGTVNSNSIFSEKNSEILKKFIVPVKPDTLWCLQ
jgi:hypothetical protein